MNRTFAALTLAATLAVPTIADEPKAVGQETRETAAEPKVPASVHGFSGEIVGTIVSKNTDGASLVIKVQQVESSKGVRYLFGYDIAIPPQRNHEFKNSKLLSQL